MNVFNLLNIICYRAWMVSSNFKFLKPDDDKGFVPDSEYTDKKQGHSETLIEQVIVSLITLNEAGWSGMISLAFKDLPFVLNLNYEIK